MLSGQCEFQTSICCESHYCQVFDPQLCNISSDLLEWQMSDSGIIHQKRNIFMFYLSLLLIKSMELALWKVKQA